MGTTSVAARKYWKNRKNRLDQSKKVRGRKFTPREPPHPPPEIERFAALLTKAGMTVLGAFPAYAMPAYGRHAWILTIAAPIHTRRQLETHFERDVLAADLVLLDDPIVTSLGKHKGAGIACVVGLT